MERRVAVGCFTAGVPVSSVQLVEKGRCSRMMELPEAVVLARQWNEEVRGKTVQEAAAALVPHGFAFYAGDPAGYGPLLTGKTAGAARPVGGYVLVDMGGGVRLALGEGVLARYTPPGGQPDGKVMLRLAFGDGSLFTCGVQMYAMMFAFRAGEYENPYLDGAGKKPSPLAEEFGETYFEELLAGAKQTLSAKAFLATEQRVPGLGNGVLQDILFRAGVHPKRKLATLEPQQKGKLYASVKETLAEMTDRGGRDTEKDLFGNTGGYQTLLCAKTAGEPCPVCGAAIQKQAYMGGSVYFCPVCQPL